MAAKSHLICGNWLLWQIVKLSFTRFHTVVSVKRQLHRGIKRSCYRVANGRIGAIISNTVNSLHLMTSKPLKWLIFPYFNLQILINFLTVWLVSYRRYYFTNKHTWLYFTAANEIFFKQNIFQNYAIKAFLNFSLVGGGNYFKDPKYGKSYKHL